MFFLSSIVMLALRSGKTRQPQTGNSKWHLLGSRPLWWQLEQGLWGDHWDITAHSQLLSGLQAVMPRSPSGSHGEVCVCCNWLETQVAAGCSPAPHVWVAADKLLPTGAEGHPSSHLSSVSLFKSEVLVAKRLAFCPQSESRIYRIHADSK